MADKINPMRVVRLSKLSINTCVPPREKRLDKAGSVLEKLTGQAPFYSKARVTVRGWGIRRNEPIGASVTVRGEKALDILERALKVKDYTLSPSCFSETGCFGFGIEEHIDLGMQYDPECGTFGFNFYVILERPGARVARRRRAQSPVGVKQRVTAEDAREWLREFIETRAPSNK